MVTIGKGAKVFSTGFSLKYFVKFEMNSYILVAKMQKLLIQFMSMNVPTMCVMSGDTLAGGLIMSMTHDFRIASEKAKVQLTEFDIGLSFAIPYSKILEHTVGRKSVTMMGERYTAVQAQQEKIVDSVYKDQVECETLI